MAKNKDYLEGMPYEDRFRYAVKVAKWRQVTKEEREVRKAALKKGGGYQIYGFPENPMGIQDKVGVWWPTPLETRDCCRLVRASIKFRWHLYRHCCSTQHIAKLCFVDEMELRRVVNPREYDQVRCHSCGLYEKDGECNTCVECIQCGGRRNPRKHDYLCRPCRAETANVESPRTNPQGG